MAPIPPPGPERVARAVRVRRALEPRWPRDPRSALRPILTGLGLLGLVLLTVQLADLFLLIFASVLMAMILHIIAAPLQARLALDRRLALSIALAVVVVFTALILWLFGSQMAAQLSSLAVLLPKAWAALERQLSDTAGGALVVAEVREALQSSNGRVLAWGSRVIGGIVPTAAGAVIVACASAYLAFHPGTYLAGALKLIPPRGRQRAAEVVEACRVALTRWLFGQLVSVVFVAVTVSAGLWAAGVPSPLALGLLAGLAQVVPVVGPLAATAVGLVIAFADGTRALIGAAVVFVAVGQVESNILTPLVLRRMAQVPMAITLFAVIAMGILLGPLGVLLATPLTVVVYVLVRELYLVDTLRERLGAADGIAEGSGDRRQ